LIIHPEKKISLRIGYINLKHQEQDVGHLKGLKNNQDDRASRGLLKHYAEADHKLCDQKYLKRNKEESGRELSMLQAQNL